MDGVYLVTVRAGLHVGCYLDVRGGMVRRYSYDRLNWAEYASPEPLVHWRGDTYIIALMTRLTERVYMKAQK